MKTLVLLLALDVAAFALTPEEEAKVKDVAREYIKDHLKAPASAIFSKETVCAQSNPADALEANGTGPTPECKPVAAERVGRIYVVYRASVDAQNSYGALIRNKYQLHVGFVDGNWSVSDAAESVRLLKEACVLEATIARENGKRPDQNCDAEYPNVK